VETQDAAYFENGRAVNINVRGRWWNRWHL
jgi:hypothetical protein